MTTSVRIGWNLVSTTTIAAVLFTLTPVASAAEIPFRNGPRVLPDQSPGDRAAVLEAATRNKLDTQQRVVVQLGAPIDDAQRGSLADAGITLLNYIGNHAYFASLAPDRLDIERVERVATFVGVHAVNPEWKLHPEWSRGDTPSWIVVDRLPDGTPVVAAYVLFHRDVDLLTEGMDTVGLLGAEVVDTLESVNGLVVHLDETLIPTLAAEGAVQWVDMPLPRFGPVNNNTRARTQAEDAQAAPYNLDGSGVTVLVYDAGTARSTHVDFEGRLTTHDFSGQHYHATHVAGTIGGAGIANALYRGQAPGVSMVSFGFEYSGGGVFLYQNPGDIETDYGNAINNLGADISNNSIGSNISQNFFDCNYEGDYGATAIMIDTIVRGDGSNPNFTSPFRIVWSNGNERGDGRCGTTYSTVPPPANAKNHITVGALEWSDDSVSSFTSWGPSDDGRMKPDVCAPGVGVTSCDSSSDTAYTTLSGTSMSGPAVCGAAALLLEDYRAQYATEPDFRNSTLKTFLAHTAVDLVNAGPDYQTGYGSIRIRDAIDFMRTGNFLEDEVTQGQTYGVLVSVLPGTSELKVTMAWDDYPGTANSNPVLVNDLDLRVFDPSLAQHFPWALNPGSPSAAAVRTQANRLDNIEQVYVANPTPGIWIVEVHGYDVPEGPQPFSLCASPQLIACSSQGTIKLDATAYACDGTATLILNDCDLNTDDQTIQTTNVLIYSDSEPAGESVLMTESGAETAEFIGTIQLTTTDTVGELLVTPGDVITARYVDADDGQGGSNVIVESMADVDCTGPVISNVQITEIGADRATITFDTDEPATGTVNYGSSCAALTSSATGAEGRTSHTVELTALSADNIYYLAIDAEDVHGNVGTDDNDGSCYSFATLLVVYSFPLASDPGWSTEGAWEYGQPGGFGSNNGDPTSGHTGLSVYGYNLLGDYTNDLPATYLTTPALDLSSATNTKFTFWRWLGVESDSGYDEATIEVSNNGSSWTTIWRATDTGAEVSDSFWVYQEFDISAIADGESTVYIRWGMGPTDSFETFPGWNIDDIQILGSAGRIGMRFPDDLPEYIPAGEATDITVEVTPGDEQYVVNSGHLHYRYYGGSFQTLPFAPLGGNLFQVTLPPTNCDATPEFYFSVEGTVSDTVLKPPTAPSVVYTAQVGSVTTLLHDNFESDFGWQAANLGATTGDWQRGVPVNNPDWDYDPISDADGSGQCYLTQNTDNPYNSDVDDGAVQLTSPRIDMAEGEITIEYEYYAYLTEPGTDMLLVEISSNGTAGPWTEIARHDTSGGLFWRPHVITHNDLVAASVALTDNMMLRFTANDADPQSINESGLDAFRVIAFTCSGFADCNSNGTPDDQDIAAGTSTDVNGTGIPDECETVGDLNCDGVTDFGDINAFVLALLDEAEYAITYPDCDRIRGDCNGNGSVGFEDINPFVELMLYGSSTQ